MQNEPTNIIATMGIIENIMAKVLHFGLSKLIYCEGNTIVNHINQNKLSDSLHNFWKTEWPTYWELIGYSVFYGICAIFVLLAVWGVAAWFATPIDNKNAGNPSRLDSAKRWISSHFLKYSFIFVWVYGFLVYDIGMCTGDKISLITNTPMAVLYAFKIFLFDSDVSEIQGAFHENWFFSMNFALVHFLAAIVSTVAIIKYFGFNIITRIKIWWASHFPKSTGDTYVFWGVNDNAVHLIESIKKKFALEPNSYSIIIVRSGKDDKASEDRSVFERIFNFLSLPSSELDQLNSLKCLITSTYKDLSEISPSNIDEDIIGSVLKLTSLRRLLKNRKTGKIHMLFLSDDESDNLHNATLLLKDTTVKSLSIERKTIFYCHARYDSVHRAIEDMHAHTDIRVKVIDSSHINVEMLKLNKELLPVNYVNVEKDATVSSAFNALVIGFSEVGQDSVKFLYEYAAFVKSGGTKDHAVRSDFHLDVVDRNMSDLAGVFVSNSPAIKPSMPFVEGGENPSALITLHEMDCRSVQFYRKLNEEWIQNLNYVVIATDDDELNISLGVRIFKAATRYRQNMEKLRILVRAHNDNDGRIFSIAQYYNRLWTAYRCAPDKDKKYIHQNQIIVDKIIENPIHIFGLEKATFTYSNIVSDHLEKEARNYYTNYKVNTQPDRKTTNSDVDDWDDRYNDVMKYSDKEGRKYAPTYWGLMNLRRSESQDYANSQHKATKQILGHKALELCGLTEFTFSKLTRIPQTTTYKWPDNDQPIEEINRIGIVLAQTEHLRWKASHELLGFIKSEEKDEVKLRHSCLTDWKDLSEGTRSYDCDVSDIALGITITPAK